MKHLLVLATLLCCLPSAAGQTLLAPSSSAWTQLASSPAVPTTHPAVVRIVAPGRDTVSYGSGTLVSVQDQYGIVITNWHVINEATGPVSVIFPNGFHSLGTVQRADRDWDLAAIAIFRPNVDPVPLAGEAPQPGEMLTIAGYGSGDYRAASGPCTQYVAPGVSFPYEMVELAASARQGDSGGPILNSRGELAGVLFGEGGGRTAGSYCGRVRWFLEASSPTRPALEYPVTATSQVIATRAGAFQSASPESSPPMIDRWESVAPPRHVQQVAQSTVPRSPRGPMITSLPAGDPSGPRGSGTERRGPIVQTIGWTDIAGRTPSEQVKTILAAVGALAVVLRGLKLISRD